MKPQIFFFFVASQPPLFASLLGPPSPSKGGGLYDDLDGEIDFSKIDDAPDFSVVATPASLPPPGNDPAAAGGLGGPVHGTPTSGFDLGGGGAPPAPASLSPPPQGVGGLPGPRPPPGPPPNRSHPQQGGPVGGGPGGVYGGGGPMGGAPRGDGREVCRDFVKGRCKRGDGCIYSHGAQGPSQGPMGPGPNQPPGLNGGPNGGGGWRGTGPAGPMGGMGPPFGGGPMMPHHGGIFMGGKGGGKGQWGGGGGGFNGKGQWGGSFHGGGPWAQGQGQEIKRQRLG